MSKTGGMRSRPRIHALRPRAAQPPSRVGLLLHRLQEDVLSRWKYELDKTDGTLGPELLRYRAVYERDFLRPWQGSSPDELLEALSTSDIVYCGDHHFLAPAQRLMLRLLRLVVPGKRAAVLALEMLHSRDQPLVDAFLAGRVSAARLRQAVSSDNRWPFDWGGYFPLLEFARRRRIQVLAINSEPGRSRSGLLKRRDEHAAIRLVDQLSAESGARIFVLAGDWHIAGRHLPLVVDTRAQKHGLAPRQLIIHQNHDGLYRRLMARLGRVPDVVRGGRDMFCVLNSTPLMKARAQLAWEGRRQQDEATAPDSAAAFSDVARALVRHLDLDPTPLNGVTPWEIGSEHELAGAARLLGWSPSYRRRQGRRLERGDVIHLPSRGLLLLRHPPLHRLAEAAAEILGVVRISQNGHHPRERYAAEAMRAGTLFLASRLINPRRKCDLLADLLASREGHGWAAAAWAERLLRGGAAPAGDAPIWNLPARRLALVARRVGTAWGYAVYDNYLAGNLPRATVRRLFSPGQQRNSALVLLPEAMRGAPRTARTLSKRHLL